MVALCSKTYYVWGDKKIDKKTGVWEDKNKVSSKGLQQHRNSEALSKEKYLQCLFNRETINGTNKGFCFEQIRSFEQTKSMKTYEQNNSI